MNKSAYNQTAPSNLVVKDCTFTATEDVHGDVADTLTNVKIGLSTLDAAVGVLVNRLAPVLRDTPEACTEQCQAANPGNCPLSRELHIINEGLNILRSRVLVATAALEL